MAPGLQFIRKTRDSDSLPVVVKTLQPEYATQKNLGRLKHECEITRNLDPAGVVKTYGFVHVARALGELHTHQIIHKDIKPSNIIVKPPSDLAKNFNTPAAGILHHYKLRRLRRQCHLYVSRTDRSYGVPKNYRIGGGPAGLSIASELSSRFRVLVIEKSFAGMAEKQTS